MAESEAGTSLAVAKALSLLPHPRKRRLFFALWPDEVTRGQLAAFLEALPKGEGRDMRVENLHLTLVFLGDCEEGLLTCLDEVGASLAGQPFELMFDRLGHFQHARVLWLGPGQSPQGLLDLQQRLVSLLAQRCQMPPDERPFVPHLTLRRDVRHPCPWPKDKRPVSWWVERVVLVESLHGPHGVRYQPLRAWGLTETSLTEQVVRPFLA